MIVEPRSRDVTSSKPEKPWWNRPLIGNKSLVDRVKSMLFRQAVVSEAVEFHNITLSDISKISTRILSLDREKFGNKEFLSFIKIDLALKRGEGKYQNLADPMAVLRAGLMAHHSFTGLEQIEFTHRGRTFSELYSFVDSLCAKRVHSEVFCRQIKAQIPHTFRRLKSFEGKEALRCYSVNLEKIGQHQLSLNLLYAFKRLQFRSYNIFRIVSDILDGLKRSDLLNVDILKTQVIRNYESFEKLGDLIGLRSDQQNIETYTRLFQYLALSERHARAYEQFSSLSAQLKKWNHLVIKLLQIRQQYPATEYKVPRLFLAKVPGTQLYRKYSPYFEDLDDFA